VRLRKTMVGLHSNPMSLLAPNTMSPFGVESHVKFTPFPFLFVLILSSSGHALATHRGTSAIGSSSHPAFCDTPQMGRFLSRVFSISWTPWYTPGHASPRSGHWSEDPGPCLGRQSWFGGRGSPVNPFVCLNTLSWPTHFRSKFLPVAAISRC
jgi:hypothetical protein